MIVPTLSQASGWQEARDRYGANVVFLRHALALEYIKLGQLNDAKALRRATLVNKVPYCTNMSTAEVCIKGIKSLKTKKITVTSLQDI